MKRGQLTAAVMLQERLSAGVRSLVQTGVPTEASTLGESLSPESLFAESLFAASRESLFAASERQCLQELWAHYKCERLLADLADAQLEPRRGAACHVWEPAAAPERCRLEDAFAVYRGRNALLRALRARTILSGALHVHVIEASGLIAVDQLRCPKP